MQRLMRLYTGFAGRIGRQGFWIGAIILAVAGLALSALLAALGMGEVVSVTGTTQLSTGESSQFTRSTLVLTPWGQLLHSAIMTVPFAALSIKRRHDRDFSGLDILGFLALLLLIQLLAALGVSGDLITALNFVQLIWGICLLILLGFLRGTAGPNKFGPDPLMHPVVQQ